jgi:hypothetical protein
MAIKYLAGDRLIGTTAERTALTTQVSSIPQTSYKELGRTTVSGSASSSITVSGFAAKDNLMILFHGIAQSADSDVFLQVGSGGSVDTGTNYAWRNNRNGGSDATGVSQSNLQIIESSDNSWSGAGTFSVIHIRNVTTEEKLMNGNSGIGVTGGGNACDRVEFVGKWVHADQLNTVKIYATQNSATFAVGSEVVVLGCDDDEADSGTNFFQQLNLTTAGGSDLIVNTGTFTAKKYLMIDIFGSTGGDQMDNFGCRYNGTAASGVTTYSRRVQVNSDGESTSLSGNYIRFGGGSGAGNDFLNTTYIINKAGNEKISLMETNRNKTTGAGTASERFETIGKWADTSSAITSYQLKTDQVSSSEWTTNTKIRVWGSD